MEFPTGKKIILFDGDCNLCNQFIQKIIAHDHQDVYRFASLNSEYGQKLQKYLGIDPTKVDSIILYEPGVAYYLKSEAAIEIIKSFGGWYQLMSFAGIFPKFIGNALYDFVAFNRYKWFGKTTQCLIATQEIQQKFLD